MTIGLFVASVVLLAAFVFVESRVKAPLLPLRVITDRNRGGVYLSLGLADHRDVRPVPLPDLLPADREGLLAGQDRLRLPADDRGHDHRLHADRRPADDPGPAAAADGPRASWSPRVGMLLLTQLEIDSSYAALVLPGACCCSASAWVRRSCRPCRLATHGVEPRDAGVASAMVNTSQQVGGAIGTALLNTIAASRHHRLHRGPHRRRRLSPQQQLVQLQGMVHGYTNAIWLAVGILVAAAAIAFDPHQRRPAGACGAGQPGPARASRTS